MSGFRLSLAGMTGLVAMVALALVSLRSATVLWTMIGASTTLALLLAGVLGARYGRPSERAFWFGFVLFGGTYLVLVNWDWVGGQFGYDLTRGLGEWADAFVEPPPATQTTPGRSGPSTNVAQADRSVKVSNVVQLARMFLSLVFAIGGGLTARSIQLRADHHVATARAD